MSKTTDSYGKPIKKNRGNIVFIVAFLGLMFLFLIAVSGNTGCSAVQITAKHQVANKYYYQFSDGSGVWSDQNFSLNDYICIDSRQAALAQK